MKRWAIVRDGVVENVCLWDGNPKTWQAPPGVEMVDADNKWLDLGWKWNGNKFDDPKEKKEKDKDQVAATDGTEQP